MSDYQIVYYKDSISGKLPVSLYIKKLGRKDKSKIYKYIEILRKNDGRLCEPYSKNILGKIRELRIDFSPNRHRIFYFTFKGKKIVLLHSFLKKTQKTPKKEINKAVENYKDFINYSNYE